MVITHAAILLAAVSGLLTGIAALVNAVRGRKASERNEAAILVVHDLVNGERAALVERAAARDAELAQVRAELAALRDN